MRTTSWLLSERGSIATQTFVDNSGGGAVGTLTWGASVPCRVDAMGGGEGEAADRISDRSTHLVTFPAETSVTTAQKLAIAGRGTYEVTAVRENSDELARFVEVVAKS